MAMVPLVSPAIAEVVSTNRSRFNVAPPTAAPAPPGQQTIRLNLRVLVAKQPQPAARALAGRCSDNP
jgi:hypothetical protein